MKTVNQALLDALFEISGHLGTIADCMKASRDQEALMHDTGRARRDAQIEALRMVRSITEGGEAYVPLVHWIDEAIRRLENGGEL